MTGEDTGARLALELTRGDLKQGGGRTPFQILGDFGETGDVADLRRFQEWVRATKGQHFARWSNGAKNGLRLTVRTDDEIVAEEVGGETVYVFGPEEWAATCKTPGAQGRVLRAAEDGGARAVRDLLSGFVAAYRRRRSVGWEREMQAA